MKFSALTILTFAAAAVADLKFDLKAGASGTALDGVAIKKVDSHLFAFSVGGDEGDDLSFTFKGSTLVDQDGAGARIDPDWTYLGSAQGSQSPTEGFSHKNDKVLYQGNAKWQACPVEGIGHVLIFSEEKCYEGIDIQLVMANQQEV